MKTFKLFGASFDPSDSLTKIMIKRKYLDDISRNIQTKHNIYQDVYDALTSESKVINELKLQKIGKFPVESWLQSKPEVEDLIFMMPEEFRTFLDTNGCMEYTLELEKFIEEKIFPDFPVMVGVDHSLTGGVLKALSKKYGADNITVIILDGHFDAVPTNLRLGLASYSKEHKDEIDVIFPSLLDSIDENLDVPQSYNCGTFLYYLIKENIIIPKNLIIFGTMDYPGESYKKINDIRVKKYIDFYLKFEEQGTKFIPNNGNCQSMNNKLENILQAVETPYLYVSIDVDIGSLNSILAARFMEFIGLDEACLIDTAQILRKILNKNKLELIGLDLMEIDIYFLNAKLKSGKSDKTIKVMDNFLKII
ncbi:MAG: arginase family protein [Candidatus Helarchaeota archaeon]